MRRGKLSPLVLAGIAALAILRPLTAKAEDNCRVIKGELSAWNGTPSLRIQVGKHLYGVVDSDTHPLPAAITQDVDFDHSVTGSFTVCQLGQAQPDGMIYVWLKLASSLKVVPAP
jgi:hypothetical protein